MSGEEGRPDNTLAALKVIVEHDPVEEWPFSVRLNIHALAKTALLMYEQGKEIKDGSGYNA